MTHLLFLIPLSIGMGLIGLAAFFWALRNDQFEDPDGNACRILAPEDPPDSTGKPDAMVCNKPHPATAGTATAPVALGKMVTNGDATDPTGPPSTATPGVDGAAFTMGPKRADNRR